ncbi:uncharacterized protein admb [Clarias gariepinus]|uniref:pro-adrenomedullin n=1 Tax=Clarias gariepinus TaxID=13013 RepID=UPI00234E0CAD|nr:pro-adrenomedullin [Clarias gariepinus]XP_053355972.1 pro-adrenomedullin [Clarias gariepinus]
MKVRSQAILFYCLLASFLHCVTSATLSNSSDEENKDMLHMELQRKDLCEHNRSSDDSVEKRDSPISQNSDQSSGRVKRGCNLLTCSIHDLAYRLHNTLKNKPNNAPPRKISPCGYGRRRRRSLLQRTIAPAHGEGQLNLSTLQAQRRDSPQKLT